MLLSLFKSAIRKRPAYLPAAIALLVLAVAAAIFGTISALQIRDDAKPIPDTASQTAIVWPSETPEFSLDDRRSIEDAIRQQEALPTGLGLTDTILHASRSGDWAEFAIIGTAGPIEQAGREPGFLLAHREAGGTWALYVPGTSTFCTALLQAPNALINASDKQYFCQ